MLYISRYIDIGTYGLVDTDDGREEVVSLLELSDAVYNHNIQIYGVDKKENFLCVLDSYVHVYQPAETLTREQLKLRMLGLVDIKCYKDMITSISWRGELIKKPIRIRLSDFGTDCADYLFAHSNEYGTHKVTLVLDEKIHFGPESFCVKTFDDSFVAAYGIGVVFDVSELSTKTARKIYGLFMGDLYTAESSIIDKHWRKKNWKW